MKKEDLNNSEIEVNINDLENYFDIVEDKKGNLVYNLNASLYIDADYLPVYKVTTDTYWPLVSYNLYGTTRLSWLLWKVNDIEVDSVFNMLPAGKIIRYVPQDQIRSVLLTINNK